MLFIAYYLFIYFPHVVSKLTDFRKCISENHSVLSDTVAFKSVGLGRVPH